ncbi:VWA domain-containing protein [Rubripirellula sp.]|nr:VWA domain-containing protein [Rubripirellula sp.]MDA7874637.1 VWA domain-containing protein [Rhodopirellula sp.]MDA8968194.1 VWA domain-containing protein [bacterium]MDB4474947.1 VWA domain-containing protein [bacterium]MDB4644930.1 VWA domain-containing protein [Rubripirellula sp.]
MFHNPWFLTLLLLVPYAAWRLWRANQVTSINYSSAVVDWAVRPTFRQRLLWLPPAMTLVAILLMILSLARPRHGREQTMVSTNGVAIELVVDRSGSMQALDFKIDGKNVDRLTAIKNVAGRFVMGSDASGGRAALEGRVSDLIGLVTFAGYADAITPLTLDHTFLVSQLQRAEIVTTRGEDGTAIGDAISLAVDKLNNLDSRQADEIKSKVVILLTDGENTAGEIDPEAAAELAKTLGVKVYTIGVGTRGVAPFPVRRFDGRIVIRDEQVNIDEATLKEIADTTGGKYFRATDTASLEAIYNEINKLETTEVEARQFVDYRELAVQQVRIGGVRIPSLLSIAMVLLTLRMILSLTFLRRLV